VHALAGGHGGEVVVALGGCLLWCCGCGCGLVWSLVLGRGFSTECM
jgi:hypothetical protein